MWSLAGSPDSPVPEPHFYLLFDTAFQKRRVKTGRWHGTETVWEYWSLLGVEKEAIRSPCLHLFPSSINSTKVGSPNPTYWWERILNLVHWGCLMLRSWTSEQASLAYPCFSRAVGTHPLPQNIFASSRQHQLSLLHRRDELNWGLRLQNIKEYYVINKA